MSAARHALAIALMLSALGGAGWFGLLAPHLRAIDAAEGEEARLKVEYTDLKSLAINLDLYRQQLQTIDERFGALLAALPLAEQLISAENQQDVERQIQSAAESLGLPAPKISAGRAFGEDDLAAKQYDIVAAGDFRQLVRFLQAISTGSGRFWTVRRALLQPAGTGTDPDLKLTVSLRVHGFLQPAPLPDLKRERR